MEKNEVDQPVADYHFFIFSFLKLRFSFSIAMAITFFKTPRNKKYDYRPVYYDAKKEEREKRLKTAYEEGGDKYEQALRDRIQMRWKRGSAARDKRASNQRLVIIMVVIFMLAYLVFFR